MYVALNLATGVVYTPVQQGAVSDNTVIKHQVVRRSFLPSD